MKEEDFYLYFLKSHSRKRNAISKSDTINILISKNSKLQKNDKIKQVSKQRFISDSEATRASSIKGKQRIKKIITKNQYKRPIRHKNLLKATH